MNTPHTTPHTYSLDSARRQSAYKRCRGMTLVEMLVTLCVAAVLLAGAVTALNQIGLSMKLSAFSNAFVSQLNLARSEAIKRNSRVVMCKSSDGVQCATGGGWEQGWVVFHDANNNGIREPHETLIRRGEPLPEGYRVAGNQSVARYVSFSPFGGTRLTTGAFQAGTITLCRVSHSASEARQVVINSVGRPRIQKATLTDCLV
jgi:type IV fimbrial biogenesis protein FimT